MKHLYIAEKPSVAREFARALGENTRNGDGYLESENAIITWCVGHLVSMSYPDAYDPNLKKWRLDTLPFLPDEFLYEIIPGVKKQFQIVSGLLNRKDVDIIYICTDSGREGEYIYRLVDQMAKVDKSKDRRRVWIDSQTREEILRGIREARDWSDYDNLAASAYLRAKEDYLMGINFSRVLTLKYGNALAAFLKERYAVISVGRVMTCVLGMVVRREREIRAFVKTPFYRVLAQTAYPAGEDRGEMTKETPESARLLLEWKAVEGSRYFASPKLYKDNGFRKEEDARALIGDLSRITPQELQVASVSRKQEKKNPPLLYNLAELQNDCSRMFKISPDQTLQVVQELYERKLVTYPRTDARVLSSAVAKEIDKNLRGLKAFRGVAAFADHILDQGLYKKIAKSRYVNDAAITDHYAIIPTGQGTAAFSNLKPLSQKVYEQIVRRFLAIFLPPAIYQKVSLDAVIDGEHFFLNTRVLKDPGYLKVMKTGSSGKGSDKGAGSEETNPQGLAELLAHVKKGSRLPLCGFTVKEGETTPPKRYNSGSIVLAMENAGQLIEDEELREQIRGSGIGTSATRAEILKKLIANQYLALQKKTQIISPTLMGELIYDIVDASIRPLLNAELTASWEKGLTYVAEGSISPEEYMQKLSDFIRRRTGRVIGLNNQHQLQQGFLEVAAYYNK